jgi:hypothetical protein
MATAWNMSEHDFRSRPDVFAIPWSDLNNVVREIRCVLNDAGPWANATSGALAYELQRRLARGDCALAIFFTKCGAHIFVVDGQDYWRYDFPENEQRDFVNLLIEFQASTAARDKFMQGLHACTDSLSQLLKEAFDAIAGNSDTRRLFILPEPFHLPVFGSVVARDQLRRRLKSGDRGVAICPVLYPQGETAGDLSSLAAFWFREDDLMLNTSEVDLVIEVAVSLRLRKRRI